MLELSKISPSSSKAISTLIELTREIWSEHIVELHGEKLFNYIAYFLKFDSVKYELKNKKFTCYFIEWNKEKIGFLLLEDMDEILNISRFYIKKEYRRKGIGFKVLQRIFVYVKNKKFKYLYAYVNKKNYGALRFFKRQNFFKKCSVLRYLGSENMLKDCKLVYEL